MSLPKIRHTSKVWLIKEPPRTILHVMATIPQQPASEFANERYELRNDVAFAIGDRREYDDSKIHWTDDNANGT
jgi:hypothetical protein